MADALSRLDCEDNIPQKEALLQKKSAPTGTVMQKKKRAMIAIHSLMLN